MLKVSSYETGYLMRRENRVDSHNRRSQEYSSSADNFRTWRK